MTRSTFLMILLVLPLFVPAQPSRPNFDLTLPTQTAHAFLYVAAESDYSYLRSLCNPFVDDHEPIGDGIIDDWCYWLPAFASDSKGLPLVDNLTEALHHFSNCKVSDAPVEYEDAGTQKLCRVQLDCSPATKTLVLKKAGKWWFIYRIEAGPTP